ncbi:Uncharacterised protein [Mycobacteroides abscessus subsp. abscessus]|nr:Uncharacterised protein [Mycobacteroides abscessus subsp. abscessus]
MSCRGVRCPKTETTGPNGMTAYATIAGTTEMMGASR